MRILGWALLRRRTTATAIIVGFLASATPVAAADTSKPWAPPGLFATTNNTKTVELAWDQAYDNVGVTAYVVFRNGIEVETVSHDDSTFVDEYYAQVTAAFARRHLTPTYPASRVATLIRHLGPTGNLLLLRARTSTGEVAATGMFPGVVGGPAEFWMGARARHLQHRLPNEALMFEALRRWRELGAEAFEFGGGGHHKAKYGGIPVTTPWLRSSLVPGMGRARQVAVATRRRLRHRHR